MKRLMMILGLTIGILFVQGNWNTASAQKRTKKVHVIKVRPQAKKIKKPRRPSAAHIWIADEWKWNGRNYVLIPGRWAKPQKGMIWRAGNWKQVNGGSVWIAGRWIRR